MFEEDPIPVNRIPFDGPTSFKAVCEQIALDAQKAGMDRINTKKVQTVILYVFSVRCALMGMPHFVLATIGGFGYWIPNAQSVRLRIQYYEERKKYRKAFSNRLKGNHAILKYSVAMYKKYREQADPVYYMKYSVWKKATGRQKIHDRKYRELNKIREKFAEKEKKKYDYITIKKRHRKNYR